MYNSDFVVDSLFVRAYASLPRAMRFELGHEFNNFVKGCTFRGRDCRKESCENTIKLLVNIFEEDHMHILQALCA